MALMSFAIWARLTFMSKMPLRILVTFRSSNAGSTPRIVATEGWYRWSQLRP
jgi:hypothetical protein